MKIIRYDASDDIDVMFLDEHNYVVKNTTYSNFKTGQIKNPFDKSIYGIGYLGDGNNQTKINGKRVRAYNVWHNMVVMSHYPIMFYQSQHRGSILLYGHVHQTREEKLFQDACKHIANTTDIPMNCYNVGCMLWDYTPVTLKQILEKQKENN